MFKPMAMIASSLAALFLFGGSGVHRCCLHRLTRRCVNIRGKRSYWPWRRERRRHHDRHRLVKPDVAG